MSDDEQPDAPSEETPADPEEPTNVPALPVAVLEKLDPEDRKRIETTFAALMAFGPMPNPITAKVTGAHIDKMLDLQTQEMTLGFDDRKDSRRLTTIVFLGGLALVIGLVVVLALMNRDEILQQLLPIIIAALGGFGGGYGFAERRRRD